MCLFTKMKITLIKSVIKKCFHICQKNDFEEKIIKTTSRLKFVCSNFFKRKKIIFKKIIITLKIRKHI